MQNNITLKHGELIKDWSNQKHHVEKDFIIDGIIEYSSWERANKKILLLLKEAYGDYGDLCWLIRDEWKGPKYKIWWTVSYWIYAINKLVERSSPIFPNTDEHFEECSKYLLSSAVVNVKKSNGKSNSTYEDILGYAERDSRFLNKQISIINPDIIICGNTFEAIEKFWREPIQSIGNTGFLYKTGNKILINWWHPAHQYPKEMDFYALVSILKEANCL